MTRNFIVITTINSETDGIRAFAEIPDHHVIVVGDRLTPRYASTDRLTFLSFPDQPQMAFSLGGILPSDHYSRKNLGYLHAINSGATSIYESDDDNLPNGDWSFLDRLQSSRYVGTDKYVNAYRYFSDQMIWPRGYPLDEVKNGCEVEVADAEPVEVGVWQGLADNSPDVDAIFRLLLAENVLFERKPPFLLPVGSYCPFNSQNTRWLPAAFAYMYLPATVSFRWTDILRGYIAQRCLWEHGLHLGFSGPSVCQRRNRHDLMKDFRDEIPCYLNVKETVATLDELVLGVDPFVNLEKAYEALVRRGLVDASEMDYVKAWIHDCHTSGI